MINTLGLITVKFLKQEMFRANQKKQSKINLLILKVYSGA